MQLIGLTGKKRAGKDTACDMLQSIIGNKRTIYRSGFADAVYADLARMLGVTVDYMKQNKPMFRLMLQGYGTDYCRAAFGSEYWIHRWWGDVPCNIDVALIPDVRFMNEVDFMLNNGGEVWRVDLRGVSNIKKHASETELDGYEFPTIDNNKSPQYMMAQLQKLYALYSTKHPVS